MHLKKPNLVNLLSYIWFFSAVQNFLALALSTSYLFHDFGRMNLPKNFTCSVGNFSVWLAEIVNNEFWGNSMMYANISQCDDTTRDNFP